MANTNANMVTADSRHRLLNIKLHEVLDDEKLYLSDLHTHLLGMGNTKLWIKRLIDENNIVPILPVNDDDHVPILPTHREFCGNPAIRKQLCRLIWNPDAGGFIKPDDTKKFFDLLIIYNFPEGDNGNTFLNTFVDRSTNDVFEKLINDCRDELKHYNLSFAGANYVVPANAHEAPEKYNIAGDFTYDVVLTLEHLSQALGVTGPQNVECDDLIQSKVEEKLGIHTYESSDKPLFRRWIVFNARKQKFEVVKGITVENLRDLITVKEDPFKEIRKCARAHVINAFSMCNPSGNSPNLTDFHQFHGAFTPEFYPRRFAIKDSLYLQRLDILAALLVYVLHRYQECKPPVRYCELSVSVADLCREWVFDVLCSFPAYDSVSNSNLFHDTSFRRLILVDKCFPHLHGVYDDFQRQPSVHYRFVAGFKRHTVKAHGLMNQKEAISLLNDSPNLAIHYMLQEIERSERREPQEWPDEHNQNSRREVFGESLIALKELQDKGEKIRSFYSWVVGLDLFGDEMGYPYCPFVAWRFIDYVNERRKQNKRFGLRIHCGENVPFADADTGTYRHFIAHMYIVYRCLRFLQHKLENGIRIGHGIAFARILSGNMNRSTHRKSSVLLAEMAEYAKNVLKNMVFEINITSNRYLLEPRIRGGNVSQSMQLDAFLECNIPFILSTDDDGVWPIDNCNDNHSAHHSLSAEYCQAISSSLLTSVAQVDPVEQLRRILQKTNQCHFCSIPSVTLEDTEQQEDNEQHALPVDDNHACTIVFHPDLIKTVLRRQYDTNMTSYRLFEDYQSRYQNPQACEVKPENWLTKCESFAPFAFVAYHIRGQNEIEDTFRDDFARLFPDHIHKLTQIHEAWMNVQRQFMSFTDQNTVYKKIIDSGRIFLSQPSHDDRQQLAMFQYLLENYGYALVAPPEIPFWMGLANPNTLLVLMQNLISYISQIFSRWAQRLFGWAQPTLTHSYHAPYDIRIFTPKLLDLSREDTIQELDGAAGRMCARGRSSMKVKIYTSENKGCFQNTTKYKNIQFKTNFRPDQRTRNPDDQEQEEHLFYVVCRHASAATAYLHHIVNNLNGDH